MKNRMKNRINKGFTIIEVIIVLVIAAIIMLAVFLVVPQLQRAQRNTRRQQDARAVLTASTQYTANNNGFPLPNGNGALTDITNITGIRNIPGSTTIVYTYIVQDGTAQTTTDVAGSTVIRVAKAASCFAGVGATFVASPTSTAVGITLETNDPNLWLRYCITP